MRNPADIRAGHLRTRVEFQRLTLASDGAGGFTENWQAIAGAPTRAHVQGVSGQERLMADRVDAQTTDKLTCRYFAGLTPVDRVLVEGVPHAIVWIDNVQRHNRQLEVRLRGGAAT